MMKLFNTFFYFLFMLLSVWIIFKSEHWFGAWVGLELGLLSFVPFSVTGGKSFSIEVGMKYFLIQSSVSLMLLMMSLFCFSFSIFYWVVFVSLVVKMGLVPFHFWFIQLSEGLDWFQLLNLMSTQKIGPLVIISWLGLDLVMIFMLIGALSVLVGVLGGLNEIKLKKILAFSSVNQFGWIFSALSVKVSLSWVYVVVYIVILIGMMMFFMGVYTDQLGQIGGLSGNLGLYLFLMFLSLGGMPPLLGFFPKMSVIYVLMGEGFFLQVILLVLTSLVQLFIYVRFFLLFFSVSGGLVSWNSLMSVVLWPVCLNFFGGFIWGFFM